MSDPGSFEPEPGQPEPGQPEPAGAELHALPAPPPEWEEDTVRSWLVSQGALVHGMVGVGETDWVYTEAELKAIAGPLTRVLNRYDVTRAAAGLGDEGAVMIGMGAYVGRSYRERRQLLAALRELGEQPVSGVAAEPGTGPDGNGAEPEPGGAPSAEGFDWRTGSEGS